MNKIRMIQKGSVRVRIDGRGTERFFNIAAQRKIEIWDIETGEREESKRGKNTGTVHTSEYYSRRDTRHHGFGRENESGKSSTNPEKTVYFKIVPRDFKRLKSIAVKTNVRLRITEKYGVPFWLIAGRRRSLWLGGLTAFFLLIFLSSFYVWDISFDGNRRFTNETLLHFMDTIPVRCGMRKREISCADLESRIRNAFPEISWVSAELTGTKLTIHVRENDGILRADEEPKTPCDLAAKADGTVTKMIVRNGIALVKKGDVVASGDILVSGELPIYDDSETLVKTNAVHADAEVYAETTETAEWTIPVTEEVRAGTGKKRPGLFFKFMGAQLCFLTPNLKKESSWEFFTEEFQFRLSKNFCLPIYFGILTAKEYVPYEKAFTETEISDTADRYLNEYMQNLTEKGIQILGSDVKIERSESHWKIHGTLTVVEDIAKESPIPEDQKEIQTVDEHH